MLQAIPVIVFAIFMLFFIVIGAVICGSWYDAGVVSKLSAEECEALARAHESLDATYKKLGAPSTPDSASGWRKIAAKKRKQLEPKCNL